MPTTYVFPYVTYITWAETFGTLAGKLVTIVLMGWLVYAINYHPQLVRVSSLSQSMYIYLGAHIIGSAISLPLVHILNFFILSHK